MEQKGYRKVAEIDSLANEADINDPVEYLERQEEYTNEQTRPQALETGLDYESQLFSLPAYITLRFNYRDEEEAVSTHSFLTGEDSIGFFGEISYRPIPLYKR